MHKLCGPRDKTNCVHEHVGGCVPDYRVALQIIALSRTLAQ